MLRARLPLAVALLAATVAIPATAASAADSTPIDPTGAVQQVTGQSTDSGTQAPSDTTGTGSSSSDNSGAGTTSGTGKSLDTSGGSPGGSPDLSQLTSGFGQLQDLADQFQNQLQNGGSSGSSPDIAGALQTFGTCLQSAGSATKPFLAGQQCVEDLFAAVTNDPRAHCFSENGFTLQFLIDRLQSGQPPSQSDFDQFQQNLTGLIACLSPSSAPSQSSGGGGATADTAAPEPTATSDQAPAAVAVTGNPNFTG